MTPLPADYTPSLLELLQLDAAARLEADPYFIDVPVFVVRPRASEGFAEIEQQVQESLQVLCRRTSKCGTAVQVLMPGLDGESPDAPGPLFRLLLGVRVSELVGPNMGRTGTRKSCEEIALKVSQLLHHFRPGRGTTLTFDALVPTDRFAPRLTNDVQFAIKGGLASAVKCAPVTIAASGTVTLTCSTADAVIWYTTDGSYPCAVNPRSSRYTAPFGVASGTLIRAAAQKLGFTQSDITQAEATA